MRSGQNGRHFSDDMFKYRKWNYHILIKISLIVVFFIAISPEVAAEGQIDK